MPPVTRRPLAEIDILEIWDYIADDSFAAADRWVDRLNEQFRVLATQPMMGRARTVPRYIRNTAGAAQRTCAIRNRLVVPEAPNGMPAEMTMTSSVRANPSLRAVRQA